MRVTILTHYYPPDVAGTGQLAASLAEFLAQQNHDVTVVAGSSRYAGGDLGPPSLSDVLQVKLYRVSGSGWSANGIMARAVQFAFFYVFGTLQMLTLSRQDVLISVTAPPYMAWMCVLHKWIHRGCRVVLWNMDCYPDILEATRLIRPGGLLAQLMAFIHRRLLRQVDHVICLDEAMRELLQTRYQAADVPMTLVPTWERLEDFPAGQDPPPWLGLERLGLTNRFIVLYMGNAGYGHEFETVLEAARQLRDEPVTFLFVGSGVKHAEIQKAAAAEQLDNIVTHPYVSHDERPSVLVAAGVALVTLDHSAKGVMSPSKTYAYLAMGLPVIYVGPESTNVDRTVTEFQCGFSLRKGQATELVDAIDMLRDNPQERSRLSARARAAFETAYSSSHVLPQYHHLLLSLGSTSTEGPVAVATGQAGHGTSLDTVQQPATIDSVE